MKISKRFIIYILVFLVAVSICVLQNACIDATLKKHQYLQSTQLPNHHYEGLEQFLYQNICGMSLASGLTNFAFITKDRTVCQVDFSGSFQIIPEMNNVTAICHGGDSTICAITEDGSFVPYPCRDETQEKKLLLQSVNVGIGPWSTIDNIEKYKTITNATFFRSNYPGEGFFVHKDNSVTLVGYGWSEDKRITIENSWNDVIQLAESSGDLIGLTKDGTIRCLRSSPYYDEYKTWTDIIAVYTGGSHIFGLKKDGTIKSTGMDMWGECATDSWQNIISISPARTYTVGLKVDGTVVATGENSHGQCDVETWKNIIAISAFETYTLGIDSKGKVWIAGETESPVDLKRCSDIVAEHYILLNFK